MRRCSCSGSGSANFSAVLLVGFVSAFPIIFNSWTGVKAVKEIWVRSAQSMGADDRVLFSHVILPGALPYILTGLRLGLAQAWRILVAVEMLAAVPWGLGWLIFGAREFLNTDVMLAGIAVIAVIGLTAGEIRVPEDRGLHRRALGNDDRMNEKRQRKPLDRARRHHAGGGGGALRGAGAQRLFCAGADADDADRRCETLVRDARRRQHDRARRRSPSTA